MSIIQALTLRSPPPSLRRSKSRCVGEASRRESLSLANKRALLRWLQTQIEKEEQSRDRSAQPPTSGREVIQEQRSGKTNYRQEQIRCGKSGCKCVAGELHGPYWYSYCREGGKLRSKYVGKTLKTEIFPARSAYNSQQ